MTNERPPTRDESWLAARFEEQRPHLRAVAYRMLGSASEADDAVQDAWLRASRADAAGVENLGGWLTTIVARLALDRLRTRTARREDPMGVHVPDPVVTALDARNPTPGPEAAAELADSVGLALLVVLEALTPAERLAFVLHDTFELPFEAIAPIVDRSAVATRQLASRARRRIRELGQPAGRGPSAAGGQQLAERPVSPGRQRALVTAFLAAAREGDFDGLVRILDPEVTVRADTGGATSPFGRSREIRGAAEVARSAMAFRNLAPGAHLARVNGAPGFVVTSQGRTFAILGFAFANDRIAEVDILIDPDRLARLDVSGVVG